jgi:histidinol-phosphatase (PHP family)
MSDYHLHLHPHRPMPEAPPPGTYPPGYIDRFVEIALSRGVTEIGFTEHLYRCVESAAVLGRWWETDPHPGLVTEMEEVLRAERNLSLERYVDVVLDAKGRGLPVKLGLEVDFVPGTEEAVTALIGQYPFDYLVGSIHWIGAWNFMRAGARDEFERRGVRRAWEQYFELEERLAASGMFDVLAHADVIMANGLVPEGSLTSLYEPVVAAAVSSGTAVEGSSAGIRREGAEIYPAPAFLRLFRAAGVPITLASDGHLPDEAGWGHAEVVAAARAAGYREQLRFSARRRIVVPLDDSDGPATVRAGAAPTTPAPG